MLLKAYSAAATKAEQLALLDQLVLAWAKTDSKFNNEDYAIPSSDLEKTDSEGIALTPSQANKLYISTKEEQAQIKAMTQYIKILNAFTDETSTTFYAANAEGQQKILDVVQSSYHSLAQNIYVGLVYQTRLQPYLNELDFKIVNNKLTLDFTGVAAVFNQTADKNAEKAFVDLSEFLGFQSGIREAWPAGLLLWSQYYDAAEASGSLASWLPEVQDSLSAMGMLQGSSNNDTVYGKNTNDILLGGAGDDTLYGYEGDDILFGGVGNDTLMGGDYEKDTYVFAKGHGQDFINDTGYDWRDKDQFNDLVFEGANLADAQFFKSGNDLVIKAFGSDDSVTIKNYLDNSDSYRRNNNFVFADQTVSTDYIMLAGVQYMGTEGDDTATGWKGKDLMYGGAGNDTLDGGDGDDVLDDGSGNDYLSGGDGSDTYVFGLHFGRNTVYDYSADTPNGNVLNFTDCDSSDLWFTQNGNDLLINQIGTNDQVTVNNWYSGNNYQQFTINTANGKELVAN